MSAFGTVLRAPHALPLLATSLVGRLPTAMAALAIVQLVRLQGGSFELAGILTASFVVAGAVGQPALGRWADRAGQTIVLLTAAVAGTLGFAAMAVFTPLLPVVAVLGAVVAGAFTPPLEPSLRSLWPSIVPAGAPLKAAFSLDAGAQELVFIAGPLLTVLGIGAFGATGNVFFAAALGLVGTLAFAANRMSRTFRPALLDSEPRRSPLRSRPFLRVLALLFGIGLPIGVLTITVTAIGESRGIAGFAGWALSANAVGALIGATVGALRPAVRPPEKLIAVCGILLAGLYLPLALTALPAGVLIAFAAIAGLMLPPTLGHIFGWVHRVTSAGSLNEANAWVVSALNVGVAVGTTGSGFVVGAVGTDALPLIVIGTSVITAALAVLVLPVFLAEDRTAGAAAQG
jgi:hypothetical protein